ncbi:MAG TPA: hypothetical protein VEY67_11920 [Candidatus Dormibacteraeota bacterium]|nr:hypothetical protein [Candidatus Dormibacteraeota bacterium]
MADSRNDHLGELAADAALERTDALVQATEQLRKFLDANRERISAIGGLTLIDEDPDYLAVAPDLTFRSRSRYLDEETGEWQSETEVIESPAELVELYNPADIYQAFAEAAREAAGLPPEPTATEETLEAAGIAPDETVALDTEAYAGAADAWAETQEDVGEPTGEIDAAHRLYDLALSFQERSQRSEARLLEQFEEAASRLTAVLGDLVIVDDEDERLTLLAGGGLRAEVVPEDSEGEWRTLTGPDELVEFYDPTDVFGDLAEALAEAWPEVASEFEGEDDESEDDEGEDGEGGEAEDAPEDDADGSAPRA